MGTLVLVLSIVAAALLMLVILIQNPKGGGIDSSFGVANQLGSVKKTNDVVEKATWYIAIVIVVLALSSSFLIGTPTGTVETGESKFDPNYRNTIPTEVPVVNPTQGNPGAPAGPVGG
ncbi:preprotein translocase subunit SecG [Flavobacteriales bacterium]|nr:preprotein translocase subunit SecG [Flavobacteriales bacterium]